MAKERRQLVRFLFLRVVPEWRRLDPGEQASQKQEFARALSQFRGRLLLRTYSLMGTRGDSDLMLWQVTENLETLQELETSIFATRLGGYLVVSHSYLAVTKRSVYDFPHIPDPDDRTIIRPSDSLYLFVYPFVKKREWYSLPFERRQESMDRHVEVGRKYPSITINTTYSFGLDDQEFVVAFEGNDPAEFVDLVMELRDSPASAFTERDIPVFTCIQTSVWDMLDALGGARAHQTAVPTLDGQDGYFAVAAADEIPDGGAKRVYLEGEAVALFNVAGSLYAVSDRCPHGRASLSEGQVDAAQCVLECPWHGGRFDLNTGAVVSGPPKQSVRTFSVKHEGQQILVSLAEAPLPASAR